MADNRATMPQVQNRSKWIASDRVAFAFCIAGLAFVLSSLFVRIRTPALNIRALTPIDVGQPALQGTGFAPNAVYPTAVVPAHRGEVALYGSWLGSDRSTGMASTRWFPAISHFAIMICGYPNAHGNSLFIEYVTARSSTVRLRVSPELIPGESWWVKEIELPQSELPVKFRLVAVDGSTTAQGWLGFSDPFAIANLEPSRMARQGILVLLLAMTSFLAFLGPGLMLRQSYRRMPFIWIPLPGILLMALLGLVAWLAVHAIRPGWILRPGLALLLGFALYRFARAPLSQATGLVERRVLFTIAVIAAIAVAKSVYSLGPAGELYAGSISRTLEVGERSDSRMPYHALQLIASRAGPRSVLANSFYFPWDFSSRGVLASLAVSPIVASSPVRLSPQMPEAPWQLFDGQGFTAFRISMIVMACCGLIAVFGLAQLLLPEDWAFLAFLLAATAPFVIHEVYFTWPKLLTAAFVLWAACLVLESRFFLAGLALGLGYLTHPSALVALPALCGLCLLVPMPVKLHVRGLRMLSMFLGAALWVLLWRCINAGHFAQNYFLSYFTMVDGKPMTLANWLQFRLDSLLNTLVPLNLFLAHPDSPETRSIYEPSPPIIRFFFQYWNTVPFGLGVGFFSFYMLRAIGVAVVKRAASALLVFIIPLLLFVAYWGWSSAGLLREGMQAWLLGLVIASVVIWREFPPKSDTFWRVCNWALLLRGVETACMLLLATIASQRMFVQQQFAASDILALLTMLGATGFLTVYVFRFAEKVRCSTRVTL